MTTTDPTPVLDPARVDELCTMLGDQATLLSLLEEFVAELAPKLEEMRTGLREGDAQVIDRAAHTVRGTGANLGAAAVSAAASELESRAREERLDGIAPLLTRLETEVWRLHQLLGNGGLRAL